MRRCLNGLNMDQIVWNPRNIQIPCFAATKSTILAGFRVAFCFLKMDGAGFGLVPTIYQRTPR